MTEDESSSIVNSTMRGDNVGEEYLQEDEFICPEEHDYISDSANSVYYHMLSSHEVEGDKEDIEERIEEESEKYREEKLTSISEDEEDTSGIVSKLISMLTFGKLGSN